jgi:hypothetical protein
MISSQDFLQVPFAYKNVTTNVNFPKIVTHEEFCTILGSLSGVSQVRSALRHDGAEISLGSLFANNILDGELLQKWSPWMLKILPDLEELKETKQELAALDAFNKDEMKLLAKQELPDPFDKKLFAKQELPDLDPLDKVEVKLLELPETKVPKKIDQDDNKSENKQPTKQSTDSLKPTEETKQPPTKSAVNEFKNMISENVAKRRIKTTKKAPKQPKMTPSKLFKILNKILCPLMAKTNRRLDLDEGSVKTRKKLEKYYKGTMEKIARVTETNKWTQTKWNGMWNTWRVGYRFPNWITEYEIANKHKKSMMSDCADAASGHVQAMPLVVWKEFAKELEARKTGKIDQDSDESEESEESKKSEESDEAESEDDTEDEQVSKSKNSHDSGEEHEEDEEDSDENRAFASIRLPIPPINTEEDCQLFVRRLVGKLAAKTAKVMKRSKSDNC